MLGLGMRATREATFGADSILTPQIRMLDKKSGGHKRRNNCKGEILYTRNPMPLSGKELDMLADFPPGKAKKKFVKLLKQKHGRA